MEDELNDLDFLFAPTLNDDLAKLVRTFVPTRFELEIIARHYLNDVMNIDWTWAAYQQTGFSERYSFALQRLNTIEDFIGEQALDRAIAPVRKDWGKSFEHLAENKCKHDVSREYCGCGVSDDPPQPTEPDRGHE